MKPYLHARGSVKRWGGVVEDYLPIHDFIDHTKGHIGDLRHRAMLHSTWGIYIVERVFGTTTMNSDGKVVSVRDIAEMHVIEDMGTIPTLADWLREMPLAPWMGGIARLPKDHPDRALFSVHGKKRDDEDERAGGEVQEHGTSPEEPGGADGGATS